MRKNRLTGEATEEEERQMGKSKEKGGPRSAYTRDSGVSDMLLSSQDPSAAEDSSTPPNKEEPSVMPANALVRLSSVPVAFFTNMSFSPPDLKSRVCFPASVLGESIPRGDGMVPAQSDLVTAFVRSFAVLRSCVSWRVPLSI